MQKSPILFVSAGLSDSPLIFFLAFTIQAFINRHMTYSLDSSGIHRPDTPVNHRDDEYSESGFKTLMNMQERHFWYAGRHSFILRCMREHLGQSHRSMIDLGGGVGGWLRYILDRTPDSFGEIALGDSSDVALAGARAVLPGCVDLYQVDLSDTRWKDRWDVIFLLDVIEHCPDEELILKQIHDALKPGGVLIVSAPALMCFWSYNDVLAKHLRRYQVSDFNRLAERTGFRLEDARYFMFFLSPLYWFSRKIKSRNLSGDALRVAMEHEHRIPISPVNFILSKIFSAESLFGHRIRFPWGTSVLGVFKKP